MKFYPGRLISMYCMLQSPVRWSLLLFTWKTSPPPVLVCRNYEACCPANVEEDPEKWFDSTGADQNCYWMVGTISCHVIPMHKPPENGAWPLLFLYIKMGRNQTLLIIIQLVFLVWWASCGSSGIGLIGRISYPRNKQGPDVAVPL